jgi:riboflavin biosynthesis pyrimidine reductase
MGPLVPLATLFDASDGSEIPLPGALATGYGALRLPTPEGRPFVYGNFVETLDGVVALNSGGKQGGAEISGANENDHLVMGLLRSVADAVVVGAGTLRAVPRQLWTAEFVYPPLAEAYRELRARLGRDDPPLNVVVSGSGKLDPRLPVFASGKVSALIVTTREGARQIEQAAGGSLPASTRVEVASDEGDVSARGVLDAIQRVRPAERILVEGGPHLLGDFLAEKQLDELFLTLAPQVAGRDEKVERPGFVAGHTFAPGHQLWVRLVSVKRAQSHLFLRYAFEETQSAKRKTQATDRGPVPRSGPGH